MPISASFKASTLPEQRPVVFMLNGEPISITPDEVDTTLLNWLRQARYLTGSKEGCAEGDCGACSVIITRQHADGLITHDAANACILLLPMLDGLVITTIEHIAGPNDELHPVQAAMIEHHGSQCGFCTPGFVISMVAGWRQGMNWHRQDIEDLIAGNLCRCTGYGPIVSAGESLTDAMIPKWEQDRIKAEGAWLTAHTAMALNTGDDRIFIAPETVEDLSQAVIDYPEAQIIAGATDIGLWVTKKHDILPGFISVMRVPELQYIAEDDSGFTIGCGVSHAMAKERLSAAFPQLDELWRRFGSAQVRASGTVCGNLANGSPIGDLAPAFLALRATIMLRHGTKERLLPLDQFYHGYMSNDLKDGEWLKSVHIPKIALDEHVMIRKISRRFDQDISAVMGAFTLMIKDDMITSACIGFGGMAAVPARARATEAALIGHPVNVAPDNAVTDALAQDFTPIGDVRASAAYRLHAAQSLLARALITDGSVPSLAGAGINDINLNEAVE